MMEGQRRYLDSPLDNRSIGELLSTLGTESSRLVREEIRLARAELTAKAAVYRRNLVKWVIGVACLLGAALILFTALNRGLTVLLAQGMDLGIALWVAPLILTVVLGLVGRTLMKSAQHNLKDEGVTPRATMASLREDKDFAVQEVKELRNG
jgi:hypothetical protein